MRIQINESEREATSKARTRPRLDREPECVTLIRLSHSPRLQSHGTLYSCKLPNCIQKGDKLIVMQLFPAELKRYVVELSSDSPSSLAALARTHTAYQREAEKALYDTLSISTHRDDSLKCMETLATNSEKAALVRSLIIEYSRGSSDSDNIKNQRVTSYLSKSLINMHTLSDFRVRSRPGEVEAKMIKAISEILRSVGRIWSS